MTAKLTTICFLVSALLSPVAGYTADTTEKAKEFVQDTTITTKVKTEDGVVKLTGDAKSKEEADKAAAIAQGTKGVVSVDNDIHVKGSTDKY